MTRLAFWYTVLAVVRCLIHRIDDAKLSFMVTVKVLFQGFDCKTFENTCWFPPAEPEHHDTKANDSKGSFQTKILGSKSRENTEVYLVLNGEATANYSGQSLANNSELVTDANLSQVIDSLFLNSIWSF